MSVKYLKSDIKTRWVHRTLTYILWLYRKAFYGTISHAVSVYVLVAILKKELELEASMYEILQVLAIMLFEKMPVERLFSEDIHNFSKNELRNQLYLFDL